MKCFLHYELITNVKPIANPMDGCFLMFLTWPSLPSHRLGMAWQNRPHPMLRLRYFVDIANQSMRKTLYLLPCRKLTTILARYCCIKYCSPLLSSSSDHRVHNIQNNQNIIRCCSPLFLIQESQKRLSVFPTCSQQTQPRSPEVGINHIFKKCRVLSNF